VGEKDRIVLTAGAFLQPGETVKPIESNPADGLAAPGRSAAPASAANAG
jgi:hypothetical protein